MIPIQSLLGGGKDDSERVDTSAPRGKRARDDAYNPKPAQEKLLNRVRLEAEADAIRHAEDMADRVFPIVEEAEGIGAQRVASLGAAYAAARSRLDAEVAARQGQVAAAEEQLKSTEAALEREDVPAAEVPLAPLGNRMASYWQVALAIGAGAVAGVLLTRLDLSPLGVGLVCAVSLALVLGLLSVPVGQPESAVVTGLRRNRKREADRLDGLKADLRHGQAQVRGLREETIRLAEAEAAFAKLLVATYESAASSALPVGSMGQDQGGRAIRKQREPNAPVPAWLEALEEEA